MSFEKNKRCLDKKEQKKYYDNHEFDEYLLSKGYEVPRNEVHEIIFGSSKTYEPFNMISLTSKNHRLAHKNIITKQDLFFAKLKYGFPIEDIPENIRMEFDLE